MRRWRASFRSSCNTCASPCTSAAGASKHPTSRLHIRIRSSTRKAASSSAVEPQSRHVRAEIPGVPQISAEHWRALETFDQIVRRPDLAHTMWLEPGDIQIINSHAAFADRIPRSRGVVEEAPVVPLARTRGQRSIARIVARALQGGRATVRGGIIGQHHDAKCKAFEERQAAMHMRPPSA